MPVILMALRLLDHRARYDRSLKDHAANTAPYATDWINLLGDVVHERCEESKLILYDFDGKAEMLAERLGDDYEEAAQILRASSTQPNPVWRLAEALTFLQGRKNTQQNVTSLLDSCLLMDRPNGLSVKRAVTRATSVPGTKRRSESRCMILSDSAIDYLVHVHILRRGKKLNGRPLAFTDFVDLLHERYGFCIARAPGGMTISNELLQWNRATLERRLRDLGLLVGVNDAESMKHVQPRFERGEVQENHVD